MALFLLLFSWAFAAGGELVLVLDNSFSMGNGGDINGDPYPANDPERIAVLGAQVVEGLAKGSNDQLTLVVFDPKQGKTGVTVPPGTLGGIKYAPGTPLRTAVAGTRSIFEGSTKQPKVLVLLSDGAPNDASDPAEMKGLLPNDVDVIGISYFRDPKIRASAEVWLKPFIDEINPIDPGKPDVVAQTLSAFTEGYARVLGSKPDTGSLGPGASHVFEAGRFVEEVLVAVASRSVGKLGQVKLTGPKGDVPIQAQGHNGCEITWDFDRGHCFDYRRTYATFRVVHDPESPGTYTLTLPAGSTPGEYGVILRYGLQAVLTAPPAARMGEQITVKAHLQSRVKVVDTPDILDSPNFQVVLTVGDQKVKLEHQGDGQFGATFTAEAPTDGLAEVSFSNDWFDIRTKTPLAIQDFVELQLDVPSVELGSWSGGRSKTERCAMLDLSKSPGADEVPLLCEAKAPLSCEPADGGWKVCATAPACCSTMPTASDATTVMLRGKHDHYAPGAAIVPVTYGVSPTGMLACWWVEIVAVLGLLFAVFVLYGFFWPRSFDPAMSVKIAGREAALRRATSTVLSESPGGKRGWYRHARFGLTNDGTPTRKKAQAQLLLEAGQRRSAIVKAGQGLEIQDRRSRKWKPVEPGTEILQGSTYRIGNMYLKFS